MVSPDFRLNSCPKCEGKKLVDVTDMDDADQMFFCSDCGYQAPFFEFDGFTRETWQQYLNNDDDEPSEAQSIGIGQRFKEASRRVFRRITGGNEHG